MNAPRAISFLALTATLAACSRTPLSGPPELRLGREECAECGMLVSEDQYSAASLVEREGEQLYLFFDDIGCLLDYERHNPEIAVEDRFVHDHATREWIDAQGAVYLIAHPDALPTPMASGMAAFASRDAGDAAKSKFGGDLHDLPALRTARQAWMHARYGARHSGHH